MSGDVERYFTERARTFDRLYDLPPLERLLNRVFRKAVYQRFELTFSEAGSIAGKRVLDIGCGSGRYSVEFARRGASEVAGVDFASDMLDLGRAYAGREGVSDRVRFERADFSTYRSDRPFDIAIAIGFFDYVADPATVLSHARTLTNGRLLASFPADTFPRSALRRRRYAKRGVHLTFYRRDEVAELARTAGFATVKVLPLSAGHFLVADTSA